MRITQSMITTSLLSSLNRNKESMHAIQQAITTGKEIDKASADPVRFARAARFRKQIGLNEQYLKNIQNGKSWIETTSASLDGLYDYALTLKEKAVQAADDSLSAGQRENLANEVSGLIEDILSIMNETYLGKNLFAGTKTKTEESFTFDGASVTYNGNTGTINQRIADHLTVKVNVTGQDITDTNIISGALDLKTAMENDDTAAINTAIGSLDTALNNVVSLNAAVGSIQNQITLAEDRLETANLNLSSYLSETEDVDMAAAITEYNAEEMAYRAALQSAANIMKLNLMDFLR